MTKAKEYVKLKLVAKEVLDRLKEDFNDEDYSSALESIEILEVYISRLLGIWSADKEVEK